MNADGIIAAVTPVISGYKHLAGLTLDNLSSVLDAMNGDTPVTEAEKITNEINGEDI